jgi:hypothetical protein
MDLNALRDAAIEATARALYDRNGVSASEDSEEWEEEYRKQFARLKALGGPAATVTPAPAAAAGAAAGDKWPELSGTPEEKRWGATIRAERFLEIKSEGVRRFLADTYPRAKTWIDTRDVPTATLLQRLKPQFEDYQKKAQERAQARAAAKAAQTAAESAYKKRLQDAGITKEGLVELIDASERTAPAPIAAKLAEIAVDGRALRVFETSDKSRLLIKEKTDRGQEDYGIERDEGLVADLKLYAGAPAS